MPEFEITKRTLLRSFALSGAGALGAGALSFGSTAMAADAELPKSLGDVDMKKALEPGPLPEITLGDENAPVKIIEYLSMTCPHCADFAENTFPTLKKNFIATGKVYYIFREFPFDPRATAAFMLARCAPNGNYIPFPLNKLY